MKSKAVLLTVCLSTQLHEHGFGYCDPSCKVRTNVIVVQLCHHRK